MFTSWITSNALMHSNVLNSDWFQMHANVHSSILNSSVLSRHVQKVLQASHLFTNIHGYHKTDPTDNSFTASTNVISMQYPNTLLNAKMTLPQLVGPIDVVSRIPNCFLKECQHWILQSRICTPHQSRTRTLYHFSSFIQICTKPEAFLAHQPQILDISTGRGRPGRQQGQIFFSSTANHALSPYMRRSSLK